MAPPMLAPIAGGGGPPAGADDGPGHAQLGERPHLGPRQATPLPGLDQDEHTRHHHRHRTRPREHLHPQRQVEGPEDVVEVVEAPGGPVAGHPPRRHWRGRHQPGAGNDGPGAVGHRRRPSYQAFQAAATTRARTSGPAKPIISAPPMLAPMPPALTTRPA